jgi:predicted nucleotidyltransferase
MLIYRTVSLVHRIATLMLDVPSEDLLRSVFHTLAYADVFDYPLTAREVYRYITSPDASFEDINQQLENNDFFSNIEEFYTLRGREEIVETRRRRTEVARQLWPRAVRYGGLIASLPFVKMVAVTGSLAMGNTDEGKDIDYLIVTAPNHLWTCRALALLVTRLAKLEELNLCPNYLITTNALELAERSLYVAHELAQMIPLSGMEIYDEIHRLNSWMADYLPNSLIAPEMPDGVKLMQKSHLIQKALEILFRFPFANRLEKWEMERKIARLTHEQSSSFESYFSADVCKGHIDKHGQKTESAVQERLKQATLEF